MIRSALLALALVLATPATATAQPRLLPVDEAVQRPDFFTFRAQLQAAIARRDTAAVLAVVDPHIRNSFGDDPPVRRPGGLRGVAIRPEPRRLPGDLRQTGHFVAADGVHRRGLIAEAG